MMDSIEIDLKEILKESTEKPIQCLQVCVKHLYDYRDLYFERYPIEDAKLKWERVRKKMEEVMEFFVKYSEESIPDSLLAEYFYLQGRTLNIMPEYDPVAKEALSKAVKLDATLVKAWNELGECYWKNDQVQEAGNCFKSALSYSRDPVALRNTATVLRALPCRTQDERVKNVERALVLAKEAVQMTPSCGFAWKILGTSHLSSFSFILNTPTTLKIALGSYGQAIKDPIVKYDPDVYFNKGTALKYLEQYEDALKAFEMASLLDPGWKIPVQQLESLVKFLDKTQEYVKTFGKMKTKRLQQLVNAIKPQEIESVVNFANSDEKGEKTQQNLKYSSFNDLMLGSNADKIVYGKVVCSVQNEDYVPFTFCMVDKNYKCLAVNVYNIAQGKGVIIGDAVAIPAPLVFQAKFTFLNKAYSLEGIRVETPKTLTVNGKKLTNEYHAPVYISTSRQT